MPAEPCVVPDCLVTQYSCHYCLWHYKYFITDQGANLFRPRRGDLECVKCANSVYDRGHMLCQRCWNNTNILSEEFILTERRCMVVPKHYDELEKWANIGPLNSVQFHEMVHTETEYDGAAQVFQRLRRIVEQLRIPHEFNRGVQCSGRYCQTELLIQSQELDKYVYCNLLRQGNFTTIRLDGLRERYAWQVFERPGATGCRDTPILYSSKGNGCVPIRCTD